jgi:hypothetical protein
MSEIIVHNAVAREKGYLYFVDAKGNVCRAKMNRKGGKKKKGDE